MSLDRGGGEKQTAEQEGPVRLRSIKLGAKGLPVRE